MCRPRRDAPRDELVLLDIFDVHAAQPRRCPRGHGRRASRRLAARRRRGRSALPQVLPVGVFRPVLPGRGLLCSQVHVEVVGGWPHQESRDGIQQSDCPAGRQGLPQEAAGQLFYRQHARSQLLCHAILPLRVHQLFQRDRSDVLDQLLSRWRVQYVRLRCIQV